MGRSSQPVPFAYPNDNKNQCVSDKMNVSIEGEVSGAQKSAVRVSSGAVGVKPAYKIEDMSGDKTTFFGEVGPCGTV